MSNPRRLPPLKSLMVFEAAARHLNFSAAARELGATQPAVSHHISGLEADLEAALFRRMHRGVALTVEGLRLFAAVRGGLDGISAAVAEIRSPRARKSLNVATDFGFAAYWLMPRLGRLRELAPDLDVRILTSQNAIDVRGDLIDVAIAFGSGRWPACDVEMLCPEVVIPVCNPACLARHPPVKQAADLMRWPLLHLEGPDPADWLTWDDWFAHHGLPATMSHELTFNNYTLVIQAAIAGQGAALGWSPVIDDLVRVGQLTAITDRPVRTNRGYFLVRPNAKRSNGLCDKFRDWVVEECRAIGPERRGRHGRR